MLLAASVIPMALIGGIFALYVTGTPFSVSAAIGFVALFGIAAMDGIIVLSYYNLSVDGGMDRVARDAAHLPHAAAAGDDDLLVACVGLLPAALSTGIGSQVQKPLALVVVGGMLLAPLLILLVLPVLILGSRAASRRRKRSRRASAERAACGATPAHRASVACVLLAGCAVGPGLPPAGAARGRRLSAEPLPPTPAGQRPRRRGAALRRRAQRAAQWWRRSVRRSSTR